MGNTFKHGKMFLHIQMNMFPDKTPVFSIKCLNKFQVLAAAFPGRTFEFNALPGHGMLNNPSFHGQ